MRPVLHGDVSSAARVLLRAPIAIRAHLCARMIREAEAADTYFQQTGVSHLLWGNGSLMAAARKRVLADEPSFDSIDYCVCFELVLRALITHQTSLRHC